jgi:hypothetical protein
MQHSEMLDVISGELMHISNRGYHQRVLRMHYNNNRLRSLGRRPGGFVDDPLWILNQSIHDARQSEHVSPNEKFDYDKLFFEEESRKRKKR